MKIFEFLQEPDGKMSSSRLFALAIGLSFVVDYQVHIWGHITFDPSWTTVGVVLGALGIKVAQTVMSPKPNGGTPSGTP